jgi:class 3 adenylate cyclase/tetratricopeptide (TPR) repeat protein/ABC-type transport system involved in cytochrome c biogenesis ATPase subunit
MNVGDWLRSQGFQRYEPAFVENAIDADVLPELTEQDLEKLGIPLGDRKRLIKAIKATLTRSHSAHTAGDAGNTERWESLATDAERRHLTVMICDLVDSTALSARLDPEIMRAVIDMYHGACARIVSSYDGFLGEFRGDGILAYFGYPLAHEDDAERTVRAGLDIIAAVARLETPAGKPLAVRIGIATGLVVIGEPTGEGALRERALVGQTPNIAARLQGLAEPGTIVLGASTRRLLGDLFELRDLGWHEVKGITKPVAAWAVVAVSASESRFEAVRVAGRADIVGREREMKFLLECQRLAWNGEGQIVLVSGEPGIGKSRLVAALAERIAAESYTRLRYQCSPYHTNSALHPFIAQLERAAGLKADDASEHRLAKLEALLDTDASRIGTTVPLFAALLSIPLGERYPPLALSAAQQRRRTLAAMIDQFESLARKQPILLLFEDAQWADATSLELLDMTVERVRDLPVVAILTFRPDFEPPWVGLPNVSTLTLDGLDNNDVGSVITRVTGGRALPGEVMKQIVAKTDGNPLFVEELTKAVMETGILIENGEGYRLDGPLPPLAIPATLQDSLMARLDRLAQVREIAQIGAAIGREFSYSLVRWLVECDEVTLKHALAKLEQAELVFRRGDPPDAVYNFKHALVRDAAYETLLKSRRHQLHAQIARVLEEKFTETVATQPEIVAHHFTQAGLVEPASDYWLKAGNLALSRSANAEAAKHLRNGVELTLIQPPSPARARKELDLYLALGPAMVATQGYATPETRRVFSRARDLLGDGGTPKERMTVLWGAYLAHGALAEHVAALEVARQFLALAAREEHPAMSTLANRFTGQTLYMMGNFVDARLHLERTLAICAANEETVVAYRRFGMDDQTGALSHLASILLLLGYPEQSVAVTERAVSRARSLGLVFTIALSLSHAALLGTLGGNQQRAAAYAEEAAAYSAEHGLADPEHWARFAQGALLAQSGNPLHGIALMRNAMTAAESNADRTRRTLYLGHIASAHASLGEPQAGLDVLDEAIRTAETSNERFFAAELFRLQGKMLSVLGRRNEAEAALRQALTIARQQRARWWELRSASSLATHLCEEGKHPEARSFLESVYRSFDEGFDTRDLTEARLLLDALSGAPRSP